MAVGRKISINDLTEKARSQLHKDKKNGWMVNGIWGGKRAELPPEALCLTNVRGFRRRVTVKVTRWQTHYYVSIDEEGEYFWDPAEETWRRPWDSEGQSFSARYVRERHASDFIHRMIAEHFPKHTHHVVFDRPAKKMWVYSRSGD